VAIAPSGGDFHEMLSFESKQERHFLVSAFWSEGVFGQRTEHTIHSVELLSKQPSEVRRPHLAHCSPWRCCCSTLSKALPAHTLARWIVLVQ
jgi:hypothetical protein